MLPCLYVSRLFRVVWQTSDTPQQKLPCATEGVWQGVWAAFLRHHFGHRQADAAAEGDDSTDVTDGAVAAAAAAQQPLPRVHKSTWTTVEMPPLRDLYIASPSTGESESAAAEGTSPRFPRKGRRYVRQRSFSKAAAMQQSSDFLFGIVGISVFSWMPKPLSPSDGSGGRGGRGGGGAGATATPSGATAAVGTPGSVHTFALSSLPRHPADAEAALTNLTELLEDANDKLFMVRVGMPRFQLLLHRLPGLVATALPWYQTLKALPQPLRIPRALLRPPTAVKRPGPLRYDGQHSGNGGGSGRQRQFSLRRRMPKPSPLAIPTHRKSTSTFGSMTIDPAEVPKLALTTRADTRRTHRSATLPGQGLGIPPPPSLPSASAAAARPQHRRRVSMTPNVAIPSSSDGHRTVPPPGSHSRGRSWSHAPFTPQNGNGAATPLSTTHAGNRWSSDRQGPGSGSGSGSSKAMGKTAVAATPRPTPTSSAAIVSVHVWEPQVSVVDLKSGGALLVALNSAHLNVLVDRWSEQLQVLVQGLSIAAAPPGIDINARPHRMWVFHPPRLPATPTQRNGEASVAAAPRGFNQNFHGGSGSGSDSDSEDQTALPQRIQQQRSVAATARQPLTDLYPKEALAARGTDTGAGVGLKAQASMKVLPVHAHWRGSATKEWVRAGYNAAKSSREMPRSFTLHRSANGSAATGVTTAAAAEFPLWPGLLGGVLPAEHVRSTATVLKDILSPLPVAMEMRLTHAVPRNELASSLLHPPPSVTGGVNDISLNASVRVPSVRSRLSQEDLYVSISIAHSFMLGIKAAVVAESEMQRECKQRVQGIINEMVTAEKPSTAPGAAATSIKRSGSGSGSAAGGSFKAPRKGAAKEKKKGPRGRAAAGLAGKSSEEEDIGASKTSLFLVPSARQGSEELLGTRSSEEEYEEEDEEEEEGGVVGGGAGAASKPPMLSRNASVPGLQHAKDLPELSAPLEDAFWSPQQEKAHKHRLLPHLRHGKKKRRKGKQLRATQDVAAAEEEMPQQAPLRDSKWVGGFQVIFDAIESAAIEAPRNDSGPPRLQEAPGKAITVSGARDVLKRSFHDLQVTRWRAATCEWLLSMYRGTLWNGESLFDEALAGMGGTKEGGTPPQHQQQHQQQQHRRRRRLSKASDAAETTTEASTVAAAEGRQSLGHRRSSVDSAASLTSDAAVSVTDADFTAAAAAPRNPPRRRLPSMGAADEEFVEALEQQRQEAAMPLRVGLLQGLLGLPALIDSEETVVIGAAMTQQAKEMECAVLGPAAEATNEARLRVWKDIGKLLQQQQSALVDVSLLVDSVSLAFTSAGQAWVSFEIRRLRAESTAYQTLRMDMQLGIDEVALLDLQRGKPENLIRIWKEKAENAMLERERAGRSDAPSRGDFVYAKVSD